MPNRLTRVPEERVPRLPKAVGPVVAIADAFMVSMVSRPPSGTLRTTWVTPATTALCAVVVILGIPLGIVGIDFGIEGGRPLLMVGSLVEILVALGCGAVLAVAVAQRTLRVPVPCSDLRD